MGLASSRLLPRPGRDPRGFRLALERALRMADVVPAQIDLIQAAANGGRDPDAMEAMAYEQLFGCNAKPLITALKGRPGDLRLGRNPGRCAGALA